TSIVDVTRRRPSPLSRNRTGAVSKQSKYAGTRLAPSWPKPGGCPGTAKRPRFHAGLAKNTRRPFPIGRRVRVSVVFHFMRAGALRASWLGACALTLSFATAQADTVHINNCIWSPTMFWRAGADNCVEKWGDAVDPYIRTVPQPADETERARAAERDHRW